MKPYYQVGPVTLYHGASEVVMKSFADSSVDAIVTDPPYELGFMGKSWDSSGIAYSVELWAEALRVLKPGGHLLAFGGSRTYHRMAVAIEDAGFELRDSIAWLYGSGFPKSLDVSKAIDKRPGVARHAEFGLMLRAAMTAKGYTNTFDVAEKVIGRRTGAVANWIKYQFPEAKWWPALRDLLDLDEEEWGAVVAEADRQKIGTAYRMDRKEGAVNYGGGTPQGHYDLTAPETEAARQWQGWGTALKPSHEPVVCARKPLVGTVASNVLAFGTGALNISAARVGNESTQRKRTANDLGIMNDDGWTPTPGVNGSEAGRWPTNVALDESQAAVLDAQSGRSVSRIGKPRGADAGEGWGMTKTGTEYADEGGASRFFPTFKYEAKAPTSERPVVDGVAHATVKPLALMRWLVRLVTPPGGVVLDPFAGSGTTLEAAVLEGFDSIGIELEEAHLPLIKSRFKKPFDQYLDLGDVG